jgi:hypothetical protein
VFEEDRAVFWRRKIKLSFRNGSLGVEVGGEMTQTLYANMNKK